MVALSTPSPLLIHSPKPNLLSQNVSPPLEFITEFCSWSPLLGLCHGKHLRRQNHTSDKLSVTDSMLSEARPKTPSSHAFSLSLKFCFLVL